MKAWILGGTTEGIELVKRGVPCVYTAATEYGAKLALEAGATDARAVRLDFAAMCAFIKDEPIACVLDATHPFAIEATRNAKKAADACGAPYVRVLRGMSVESGGVSFESASEAAKWLEEREGDVLLTTGSKELGVFATKALLPRLFARVLPTTEVVKKCEELGLPPARIIAMQGPFTPEMNEAMLKQTSASFLVTKQSGAEGGVPEKIAAAKKLGVTVVSIERKAEEGESPEAAAEWAKALLLGEAPRFPLWLDVRGKSAVVVGGGEVAMRRIKALLSCGMAVTVIAPEPFELEDAAHVRRTFEPGDTQGASIVLAATDDRAVNRAVALEAIMNGAWVSVADRREEGNFHFPATCFSGTAAASIHTGDPALTKQMMQKLRSLLEDEVTHDA